MNRRTAAKTFFFAPALLSLPPAETDTLPATGKAAPALQAVDEIIRSLLHGTQVPGASLAVVRDNRLVYARGYGWADLEAKIPYDPNALFRIASISKPFTSVAVLKLVEDGKLELDTPVFPLLGLAPLISTTPDPRLGQITVRHLLHHTGGWDREKSFDPMYAARRITRSTNIVSPPSTENIIRFMLALPLDFAPGSKYAYSNFGYEVLGRIIEKVSGKTYAQFVREAILLPAGIKTMRLGKSRWKDRAVGEVHYYMPGGFGVRSVFAEDDGAIVPYPYGGYCIESQPASGGWIAAAFDLARFASQLTESARSPLLSKRSVEKMWERPAPPVGVETSGGLAPNYYGLGWNLYQSESDTTRPYWHSGKMAGSASFLSRKRDGLIFALNLNKEIEGKTSLLPVATLNALDRAMGEVSWWPRTDLFSEYDQEKK